MILRLLVLVAAVCLWAPPKGARADVTLFSAREGVAIGGYDTVAFFDTRQAVPGQARHSVVWRGVAWRFSTRQNQVRFEMNPRAYAPIFGGYCAYAMSQGLLMAGDPQLWVIVDGQLFLLNNRAVFSLWQTHPVQFIEDARAHWPQVLHR